MLTFSDFGNPYIMLFLTFRYHLHFFVGQSLPPSSSTVCFQSCRLSVRMCSYLLGCCLSISVLAAPSSLPGMTVSINFLDRLSSSLLLICPYKCNGFCLRNVHIWHTLASSCMIWFPTWSFLVLPLIHRSILIFLLHAICFRPPF